MSRYDNKPTPPDRPAARGYEDETPTNPLSESIPLRGPTRLGQSVRRQRWDDVTTNPEGLQEDTLRAEVHRLRDEVRAQRGELRQQACDLASIQSQLLGEVRGPSPVRKRWSDAPGAQRTITALVTALAVAILSAIAQRYGISVPAP